MEIHVPIVSAEEKPPVAAINRSSEIMMRQAIIRMEVAEGFGSQVKVRKTIVGAQPQISFGVFRDTDYVITG